MTAKSPTGTHSPSKRLQGWEFPIAIVGLLFFLFWGTESLFRHDLKQVLIAGVVFAVGLVACIRAARYSKSSLARVIAGFICVLYIALLVLVLMPVFRRV